MKKLIVIISLVLHLSTQVFSCSFADVPFCENMDFYENIFSGVISESSDNGVTIQILENFKGTESKTSIKVWDGVVGDCNGTPESAFTKYYGVVGDTVIFALSAPIQNVELTWEVVGDYRKPINFYDYPDLWNPEFVKVENNVLHIEDTDTTYTYDEMLAYLYSGDCITNVNMPQLCEDIENSLSLPWLAELIENADGCEVGSVEQFSYNGLNYIKVNPYAQYNYCPSDLPTKVYNCSGDLICTIGGYGLQLKRKTDNLYLDECDSDLSNAAENGTLLWTYSDDCNNLQFDFITNKCSNCCEETLKYAISGGDGNYVVTTAEGTVVNEEMPIFASSYIVTDGQGCTAEGAFAPSLLCCESKPDCYIRSLYYNCNSGIQFFGVGNCSYFPTFTDEAGNSYTAGDSLPNGSYNLTNTGYPVSPPCASYELTVNCEEQTPCTYEFSGKVTINQNCGFKIDFDNGNSIVPQDMDLDAYSGKQVDLSFIEYLSFSKCNRSRVVKVICIKETDEDPYLKYPWLTELVNPETCSVKATEHRYSESYTFVFIADADGSGRLYFQDGTLYCDGEIDECLSLYNLPNPGNLLFDCTTGNNQLTVHLNNLTCSNDGRFTVEVTVTDSLGTSTNGEYGIYNVYGEGSPEYIYFAEGETIIYEGNSDDSTNSLYTVFVYDRNLADVGAQGVQINISACQVSDFPFDKYPWLQDFIDTNNCDAGNQITEYDFGFYSFVFVKDNDGGKLYFEDGTFYCASKPKYNCLALYDFKNPTSTWACGNPAENCEIEDPLNWAQTIGATDVWVYQFEGNTYYYAEYNVDSPYVDIYGPVVFDCNGEQVCLFCGPAVDQDEMELIWSDTSNDIFTTYPWLYTLVNPISCNNESIQVYTYGTYQFISIETNEGINLYFQDGTFYCADGFNYSCTQLYGLETTQNEWLCEGANQKPAKPSSSKKIDFDAYLKVYPNPSNGQFTLQLSNQLKNEAILRVMDVQGKFLQSLKLKDGQQTVPVNLALPPGMYRLQLVSDKILTTQNLIIH